MGASPEVGRHEVGVWRFAIAAVVQSVHGAASEAPAAVDLRPPRGTRVLSVSEGEQARRTQSPDPWLRLRRDLFDCNATEMDLSSPVRPSLLRGPVRGDALAERGPGASQLPGIDGVETLRC